MRHERGGVYSLISSSSHCENCRCARWNGLTCRSRENGNPSINSLTNWIPADAGMTDLRSGYQRSVFTLQYFAMGQGYFAPESEVEGGATER
jgi:hypothetical protein